MLDCPDDFHRENSSFSAFKKTGYTGTDHLTDGRTDTTSYRDAMTHLKRNVKRCIRQIRKNDKRDQIHALFFIRIVFWRFSPFLTIFGRFLDASSHLYMRSCPSVGPSVGWSVGHAFVKNKVYQYIRANNCYRRSTRFTRCILASL